MDASRIFDEIAAGQHGRMQQPGTAKNPAWVCWGDYFIDVAVGVSPADWTVKCRTRLVAKGGAGSAHGAWLGGCDAIAADLAAVELDEAA